MNSLLPPRISSLFSAIRAPNTTHPICRCFSTTKPVLDSKSKKKDLQNKKKRASLALRLQKRRNPFYKFYNLKQIERFSLCDAMRYLKATEVLAKPDSAKYEVHVKMKTTRSGPVIRQNQLHLPHPVKSSKEVTYAVICPPDSQAYADAKAAGAVLVGEEEIFEELKLFKYKRCLAHPDSLQKMNRAGLPRILGPKGMMPNPKNGTVTTDPLSLMKETASGGAIYRERFGVVRLVVGTLAYTPLMLRENLDVLIQRIKRDTANLGDNARKEIHEVVLSSSQGPGLSLNGQFMGKDSPSVEALSR